MQVQVQLCGLPLALICDIYNGGRVAFVRTAQFKPIFDSTDDGSLVAQFYEDSFLIDGEEFSYNTLYSYKEIPSMLAWLKRQNLQNPVIVV